MANPGYFETPGKDLFAALQRNVVKLNAFSEETNVLEIPDTQSIPDVYSKTLCVSVALPRHGYAPLIHVETGGHGAEYVSATKTYLKPVIK